MDRLKPKDVKAFRDARLTAQGGVCSLCQRLIPKGEEVLDHNHKTGECRGVLHRGCNSMLGKIENYVVRYKLKDLEQLQTLLSNVTKYMSNGLNVLYYTHRTSEEKRITRNKKARKKRALTKTKGVKNVKE